MRQLTISIVFILLVIVFALGFRAMNQDKNVLSQIRHDIDVNTISVSIGADNEKSIDTQMVTYKINLINYDVENKYVKYVQPIYSKEFEKRLIEKIEKVEVNRNIMAGNSIELEVKLKFDAKGLSKEQISSMSPYMTGIRVITENEIEFKTNKF